jgi:hypothetical protein
LTVSAPSITFKVYLPDTHLSVKASGKGVTVPPLYESLEIDETAGIDPDEVERIKRSLERIKAYIAGVAKRNPAHRTSKILDALEDIMEGVGQVTSVDELHALLSSDITPSPMSPPALGSGSDDPRAALATLLGSDDVTIGQKHAIRRILVEEDPSHIRVTDNGTPAELAEARREIAKLAHEHAETKQELADMRDPAVSDSLAAKLAAAERVTPTSAVGKATLQALLTQLAPLETARDRGRSKSVVDLPGATLRRVYSDLKRAVTG